MRTWFLIAGGSLLVYGRRGGRTMYLGRYSLNGLEEAEEVDYDVLTALRDRLREVKRSLPSVSGPTEGERLSFKRGGDTYWFLIGPTLTIYLYVKGPSTKHKAKYLGRRSLTDVVNLAVSAGAMHVISALSHLVNRLEKAAEEIRRRAEKAAERLKMRLQWLSERYSRLPPEEAAERIVEEVKDSEEWPLVRRHRGVLAEFLTWLEEWSHGLVDRRMLT